MLKPLEEPAPSSADTGARRVPEGATRRRVHGVALELTAYCNQKCDYCYNEWRAENHGAASAKDAPKVFARLEKMLEAFELDHVTLTGGEPFAHKDIFRLLARLQEAGVPAQIISNGALITDDLAARLSTHLVSYVQCTLNGPTAALHGEHVGGESFFEKTIAGVKTLRRYGVQVVGCIVVTKRNAHVVGEILALWRSLGVHRIALARFSPAGHATHAVAKLLPTRDELTLAFEQALPFARDTGGDRMSISCTMPVPPCAVEVERFKPIKFGNCAIGTSMQEFAIGPDGRLKNCTLHRTAIGSVPDILDDHVDLRALIDAVEVATYRSKRPEFCAGCLHEHTCMGGCGAAAEWVLGSSKTLPDPFLWQHVDDDFGAHLARERHRLPVVG